MARADLVAALRNAIERGQSLEAAKSSLINAGYATNEVEEAAAALTRAPAAPAPLLVPRPTEKVTFPKILFFIIPLVIAIIVFALAIIMKRLHSKF